MVCFAGMWQVQCEHSTSDQLRHSFATLAMYINTWCHPQRSRCCNSRQTGPSLLATSKLIHPTIPNIRHRIPYLLHDINVTHSLLTRPVSTNQYFTHALCKLNTASSICHMTCHSVKACNPACNPVGCEPLAQVTQQCWRCLAHQDPATPHTVTTNNTYDMNGGSHHAIWRCVPRCSVKCTTLIAI